MNWFTYTLIVLAVVGVAVLVYAEVRPRRRFDPENKRRELQGGVETLYDNGSPS